MRPKQMKTATKSTLVQTETELVSDSVKIPVQDYRGVSFHWPSDQTELVKQSSKLPPISGQKQPATFANTQFEISNLKLGNSEYSSKSSCASLSFKSSSQREVAVQKLTKPKTNSSFQTASSKTVVVIKDKQSSDFYGTTSNSVASLQRTQVTTYDLLSGVFDEHIKESLADTNQKFSIQLTPLLLQICREQTPPHLK